MKQKSLWVVKAGSKMVCDGGQLLLRHWMQQAFELKNRHDVQLIWVTSGAIAWAEKRTQLIRNRQNLPQKQALSAIGQPLIMDQYNLALQNTGLLGAQVLLTSGDIKDHKRRKNLINTLKELLKWEVLPILNENDAIATEEIQFGDNDSLAAKVAVMMRAQKLILLTDVDGLYNVNPTTNSKATLIEHVTRITKKELAMAPKKARSNVGTGGMYSKLLAAQTAQTNHITTHMVRGDIVRNLLQIVEGRSLGTRFGK
jgi:glutamate 5-kinase